MQIKFVAIAISASIMIFPNPASLSAQSVKFNTNVPGKIVYKNTPSWSGFFNTIEPRWKKYYHPLEKAMAKACSIITDAPVINPPRGFNIKPHIGAFSTGLLLYNKHFPAMDVTFSDYSYYTLPNKSKMELSTNWSSGISIFINDPDFLLQQSYSLEDDCDSAGIPVMYYRPKMGRAKNGDWIIYPAKLLDAVHIIKKKGVPLYIAVTKKEYLNLELTLEEHKLNRVKSRLVHDKKEGSQDDVSSDEDYIKRAEREINEYRQALSGWSSDVLNQPAYTSAYYNPYKEGKVINLVPPDYKGALEFVRINKKYFDTTLPKNAPQLILIGADYHLSVTAYMREKVKTWFNEIDYAKLHQLIR